MNWETYSKNKIIDPKNLPKLISNLREDKKSIATLNGSFDLLHAGHLYMIYEASRTADVLIVALNSDRSIQSYKGSSRPIIPLPYRMEMLTALSFVNYITWFEECDPREILSLIKPDIHVNGEEYGENCIEAETVRKNGGELFLVQRIPGLSTSEIIAKIKNLQ